MKKEISMVTAGVLMGAMLASPTTEVVSELFTAQRASYPVYVDGRSVDLDACAIDGRNNVQLREFTHFTISLHSNWTNHCPVYLSCARPSQIATRAEKA